MPKPVAVMTVPPAAPALSLADAKAHLRVDSDAEDDVIASLATASVEWFQAATDRQLATATFVLSMHCFDDDKIVLPWHPLASVSHVKYYDAGNVLRTFSAGSYYVVTGATQGYVMLSPTASWPSTYDRPDAVQITYTAGYGGPNDVPQMAKAAVKLMLGHLYENREATTAAALREVPLGVQSLIETFRSYRF